MHHRVGRASQRDGVGQGVNGQLGGHGFGHGVADDPVGAGVLDRAQLQLAVHGRMLGDVGQPQPVRCGCGERPLDQIVVDRRPRGSAAAALAGVVAEDPLLRAQPVDAVAAGGDAVAGELIGDESVAELRVVVVDVDGGVDQLRVVPVALADGVGCATGRTPG